jgi:glutathione-regulated potassium-efflux system ancillary protein KefG
MVMVAHPNLATSRANKALVDKISTNSNILIRDLYQEYPEWNIDVEKEQQLLLEHDRIVLQFPFYWYSCPPLLKKWFDDVMQYGWAYGSGGTQLVGKEFMLATTTGGTEKSYQAGGYNSFAVSELLRPIQATIKRCNGTFLPSFIAYAASNKNDAELFEEAKRYEEYIAISLDRLVH